MPLYFCVYTSYLHISLSSLLVIVPQSECSFPQFFLLCYTYVAPNNTINTHIFLIYFFNSHVFISDRMLLLSNYLKFISHRILVSSTNSLLESWTKRLNAFLPLLWLAKENKFQVSIKEGNQERKILNKTVRKSKSKSIFWWVKEWERRKWRGISNTGSIDQVHTDEIKARKADYYSNKHLKVL